MSTQEELHPTTKETKYLQISNLGEKFDTKINHHPPNLTLERNMTEKPGKSHSRYRREKLYQKKPKTSKIRSPGPFNQQ